MLYDPKWKIQIDSDKLDPTTKFLWTTALRTEKYPRGRIDLEYFGKFCALGVLCKETGLRTDSGGYAALVDAFPLLDKKQLREDGYNRRIYETIYEMNDSGKTFAEIADWIDANL